MGALCPRHCAPVVSTKCSLTPGKKAIGWTRGVYICNWSPTSVPTFESMSACWVLALSCLLYQWLSIAQARWRAVWMNSNNGSWSNEQGKGHWTSPNSRRAGRELPAKCLQSAASEHSQLLFYSPAQIPLLFLSGDPPPVEGMVRGVSKSHGPQTQSY